MTSPTPSGIPPTIVDIKRLENRMVTASLHPLTASEFSCISNPLIDSIFAHYAHTALSTANLARIYNYMLMSNVNPMHGVERHLDILAEAEQAYNL